MDERIASGIEEHFGGLKDPRIDRTKRHQLLDVLVIAICAVIAGADNWEDIAEFGRAREEWFASFLELPHGIPSHDTFNRIFARLDPEQFQACFIAWVSAVSEWVDAQVIAIDGKVLRRSHDKGVGKAAIDMVSAWATANRLVLGQVKVDDKSNEITAIPQLLDALAIEGCIVTIDALGCQTEIAEKIVERGAEYVLTLKENQGHLYADVVRLFEDLRDSQYRAYTFDYTKTVNKDHGRIEIRECWTISDPAVVQALRGSSQWKHLATVAWIRAERRIGEECSIDHRFHIASCRGAQRLLKAARLHWGIENQLHWVLDLAFDEDRCRIRKDHGAENFALLRHIAVNLLRHESTCTRGIKGKRLLAAWKQDYLLKVLLGLQRLAN